MSLSRATNDAARARSLAVRFSKARVRSRFELEARLRQAGVLPRVITEIVTECQASGLLDDKACARLWAGHWARQGYAWGIIRRRLAEKGLGVTAIELAASAIGSDPGADEARARTIVAPWGSGPGEQGVKRRLARRLATRGFESDVIERVLGDSKTLPSE